jgi:lauroyl/myristoyl acyltransferase
MSLSLLKYRLARRIERCLTPGALAIIAWPVIAAVAFTRAVGRHGRDWREAVSGTAARRPGILATWRHFIDDTYLMLATCWPDRWHGRHWADRFHVTGVEDVQQLASAAAPIVIAVVHFTNMAMLRYVLRSRGVRAAALVGFRELHPTAHLRDATLDRATEMEGVPHRFVASDLRSAYDFLRSGNCLVMACDVDTPENVAVTTPLGTLRLAVGPFRIAEMTGAAVVPAIFWQSGRWRFEARFGEPIRPETARGLPEPFRPIAERCMQHWLPVMQEFPTQYDGGLGRVWGPEATEMPRSVTPPQADT